jgi:hypothetical protein
MPAGAVNNGISMRDILNLPLTASVYKMSQLTGISRAALKQMATKGLITSIPIDGKKVLLSTWSVIECFKLAPVEVLKEIWLKEAMQ